MNTNKRQDKEDTRSILKGLCFSPKETTPQHGVGLPSKEDGTEEPKKEGLEMDGTEITMNCGCVVVVKIGRCTNMHLTPCTKHSKADQLDERTEIIRQAMVMALGDYA